MSSHSSLETVPVKWVHWPVNWSAVIVGSLTILALILVFGLIGISVGAHLLGPSRVVLEWKTLAWLGLVFNVFGVFLAFVGGGWVASKIAGIRWSETAMMHGAIVWVVTIPLIVFLAAQGASSYMGGWLGGLAGNHPAWINNPDLSGSMPVSTDKAKTTNYQDTAAAKATRNAALGAVAALLLGLMGCALGAWCGSGEAMNFSHWNDRRSEIVT
ncbi:MAG: hypothetical protein QM703_08275 [Gemmatales bacterium]